MKGKPLIFTTETQSAQSLFPLSSLCLCGKTTSFRPVEDPDLSAQGGFIGAPCALCLVEDPDLSGRPHIISYTLRAFPGRPFPVQSLPFPYSSL